MEHQGRRPGSGALVGPRGPLELMAMSVRAMFTPVGSGYTNAAPPACVSPTTPTDNLGWQEQVILMSAMIFGALPFTFHYSFVRKKFLSPKLGKEVLAYFIILSVSISLFILLSGLDPLTSMLYWLILHKTY